MSVSDLPESADCVIIGGGVVGCSLAYHLAGHGMRPLLLERNELGSGSTGRCAGGVRQQFSTEVNVRVGMMSRRMLERFSEETGTSPEFHQIGYLLLASTAMERDEFARNVEMQQRCGLDDVRLLSVDEALELVPYVNRDDLTAATFCPSDGIAGPSELTLGYAAAARREGAVILEGVTVTAIQREGDSVTGIVAGDRMIASPLVVDCAGPYAALVADLAHVSVPVKPYRRHLFQTERFELRPSPPMTVDFRSSFYFHPQGVGLLLGMSDPDEPSSFSTDVAWDFLEHLVEHATHRLPQLEQVGIRTGWAGLYEVTPDNQAIIGPAPELAGFWLCCGFSGHGFMQAPAVGCLLAQWLAGEQPDIDLSPFDPLRFSRGEVVAETAVI